MFVLLSFTKIEQCAKYQEFDVQLVLSAKCIVQHVFRPKIILRMRMSRDSRVGVKNNHLRGIPDPELPIYFTVFRGM